MAIIVTKVMSSSQHAPTKVNVSRRGRGPLIYLMTSLSHKPSALASPVVRESWTGAGRRRGRSRNFQKDTADVLAKRRRWGLEEIQFPANTLKQTS